jgi:hypothetical protein
MAARTKATRAKAKPERAEHANRHRKAKQSDAEREALLAKIKADFDERLATIASDPRQWVTFIEQVAAFGARYSLGNQLLLLMQAEERGITPQFFLPYGNRERRTGWYRHNRQVRAGETGFKVWAAIKRRPTEDEATEWEAAGRKVRRDPDGRPSTQVVGFRLESTFDLSQTDGEPFEPPTVQRLRRQRQSSAGIPQLLAGDDPTDAFDDTVKLIKDAGYSFALDAPGSLYLGDANGVTVGGDVMLVKVRNDVSTAQRLKTTVHDPLTAPTACETRVIAVPVRIRRAGGRRHPRHQPHLVLGSSLVPETKGRLVHGRAHAGVATGPGRHPADRSGGGRGRGRGRRCGAARCRWRAGG